MENKNKLHWVIYVALLIIIFFVGRCSKISTTDVIKIPVVIPQKEGSFKSPDTIKPLPSITPPTSFYYKDSLIYVPTVNQELLDSYIKSLEENDKLKSINTYAEAIKKNKYKNVFDNEDLNLTIETETEGKLLSLTPKYIIKRKELEVLAEVPKAKEKVFSMNVGAGLTTTKDLTKLDPSIHLDLINSKGNILGASYSLDGTIGVKYSMNIFNIKK